MKPLKDPKKKKEIYETNTTILRAMDCKNKILNKNNIGAGDLPIPTGTLLSTFDDPKLAPMHHAIFSPLPLLFCLLFLCGFGRRR